MESSTSTPSAPAAPPKLIFDDGSRILQEATPQEQDWSSSSSSQQQRPAHISVREYYEIDRLVSELLHFQQQQSTATPSQQQEQRLIRVALQFPDELLRDAPEVCWEFEQALQPSPSSSSSSSSSCPWWIFVLGDTTHAPCCPDRVAAAHLNADVLVHYGHACLSSHDNGDNDDNSNDCPVLYSFGRRDDCPVADLAALVRRRAREESISRILLLYEVQYHHCIPDLCAAISDCGSDGGDGGGGEYSLAVVAGTIPQQQAMNTRSNSNNKTTSTTILETNCCGDSSAKTKGRVCCSTASDAVPPDCLPDAPSPCCDVADEKNNNENESSPQPPLEHEGPIQPHQITIGGLELPHEITSDDDNAGEDSWSGYTVLFLGRDTSRQYLNLVLRLLSSQHHRPDHFWTWNAETGLSASLSPAFQRTLNRRFYLVQKAKQCRTFGLLVAHLTPQTRRIVASLRTLVQQQCGSDAATYTLVVGKLNPAKLANFPELDCFVLVACPEHSLLHNERELYAVPIVTPLELCMALDVTEWGSESYSTHPSDYWRCVGQLIDESTKRSDHHDGGGNDKDDDDDSDAPYFSLVSGTYEATNKRGNKSHKSSNDLDLAALPGQGTLTEYRSAAGEFLSQREYQGLSVAVDAEDEPVVHAAVLGQTGIASNYNNR